MRTFVHELSIAEEVLRIALGRAEEAGNGRVTEVALRIGDLTQVFADSLRFCFDVCAKDSRADGAQLKIERVAAVARCRSCGEKSEIEMPVFMCRACESFDVQVESGSELLVESITVEDGLED